MAKTPRLFLIDGSALAYRSYFAFIRNPLINSKGENTSAVFGYTRTLLDLLTQEKPEYMAVAFDTAGTRPSAMSASSTIRPRVRRCRMR